MPGSSRKGFALAASSDHPNRDLAVWLDARGTTHTEFVGPGLVSSGMQHAQRSRFPGQYQNRKTREGLYWFSQTASHVWHESGLERLALILIDFYLEVVTVTPQPCLLQYNDGSKHYPDYLVTLVGGNQLLFDIHAAGLLNERVVASFERAQEVCDRVGWGYRVFTGLDPVIAANLRHIAGYRHPLLAPEDEVRSALLAAESATFEQRRKQVPHLTRAEASTYIHHLIWRNELSFDVSQPLSTATTLRRTA